MGIYVHDLRIYSSARIHGIYKSCPVVPRIQQELCDGFSIVIIDPGNAVSILPRWYRQTQPQSDPAITNNPHGGLRPGLTDPPRFEFDSSLK